ncbi:MAG: ADOP family duplicated permease, partial [Candidatus Krumholzibacteriia bacterium]
PQTNGILTFAARSLHETVVGEVRTPLLVLLGAVGLVLLIACANVANLLLARAAARESELAVRTALGAGRGRLVRQLLTESVVLGLLGGAVGLLLAWWGTQALLAAQPADIPRLDAVDVDGTVVAFALGISLLTGIIFGLFPAGQATRGNVAGTLKEGGRGALAGRGGQRLRAGLVVAEMALAVVLLVGAGLLIRSFAELTAVDPGFQPEQAVAFQVSLPYSVYDEAPERHEFFRRLEEEVEALPGVTVAGSASGLPFQGSGAILSFGIEGEEPPQPGEVQDIHVKLATPDYVRAIGSRLVSGRLFNAYDRQDAPMVVLVNEAAVRRWFPDGEAIGERITFGGEVWREVVGVVSDLKQFGPGEPAQPELFIPHGQAAGGGTMQVVVRTAGDPMALTGAIRRTIRSMDPNLPVDQFTPLEQVVAQSVAQARFYSTLLAIFAAVALALAGIGIFGVMSYTVAQRTREIGIRIALGAPVVDMRTAVVGQAMLLALAGLGIGLPGAFALTRVLQSQLYGVSPTDPVTFAVVALTLAGAAFIASYLPARRATRVDPMTALRYE